METVLKTIQLNHRLDLTRDSPGYSIPPHTDTNDKAVTILYYLAKKDGKSKGGQGNKAAAEPLVVAVPVEGGELVGDFEGLSASAQPFDSSNKDGTAIHAAATRVLFELNRDKPMYQLLPPAFSDLWKGWLSKEAAAAKAKESAARAEKDETIQRLAREMREKQKDGKEDDEERNKTRQT